MLTIAVSVCTKTIIFPAVHENANIVDLSFKLPLSKWHLTSKSIYYYNQALCYYVCTWYFRHVMASYQDVNICFQEMMKALFVIGISN